MAHSMTGFGSATGRVGSAIVAVELRSVNGRFFNPNIKLPSALSQWEGEVRELLRRGIARGQVILVARVEREHEAVGSVDERRFGTYVEQLRALLERHSLAHTLDAATILRLPNVLASDGGEAVGGTVEEFASVVQAALDSLTAMRQAEGTRLVDLLRERITAVEHAIDRVEARAPERLLAERERLRRSVRELADGIDVDPARLAQEIAIVADRLDVSEEIDRFRAHVAAFRDTLASRGDEPIGKRLTFLLQEMVRETNSTGSKARDTVMLDEVVAVKEELERISEQVENLE